MRMPLIGRLRSLSAQLLVLTILFVMIAEVLIYSPSIGRFRLEWMREKLASGHLAALAVRAAPENMVTQELQEELLAGVGAVFIETMTAEGPETYILGRGPYPRDLMPIRVGEGGFFMLIWRAYDTLLNGGDRVLNLTGPSPRNPEMMVRVVVPDAMLRSEMIGYSWRILGLSVLISLITASLVFLTLRACFVRPMRLLTERMIAFRRDPEGVDVSEPAAPYGDELGVAEHELVTMQQAVLDALHQRERLAALGTAVTKINHDLRNILASAALLSERLASAEDPVARRTAQPLMAAIDRAITLCSNTLAYTREGAPPIHQTRVPLRALVNEAASSATIEAAETAFVNRVPADLAVDCDMEQMRRVFENLIRNSVQAGAGTIRVDAKRSNDQVRITASDNGHGLPPRARENLFQPFAGGARPGGSGLGLAIAREIVTAHRGSLRLVSTGSEGTSFEICLPTAREGAD